jgi:CRISPR system Cascade subunit CasB
MNGFIEWLEGLNEKETRVRARREMLYLVAGLWAAHWREGRGRKPTSIGRACADYQGATKSTSTERRFISLLDSDQDQLPHRLRQMVALLKEHDLDFEALLKGVLYWNDERKRTQNDWAREFYRNLNDDSADIKSNPVEEADQ